MCVVAIQVCLYVPLIVIALVPIFIISIPEQTYVVVISQIVSLRQVALIFLHHYHPELTRIFIRTNIIESSSFTVTVN